MKVEDLSVMHNAPARPRPRAAGGNTFTECLNKALASSQAAKPGAAAPGLSPAPVGEVWQTSAEMAEAALARLEILQASLARGETTLKKMAPLVQKLDEDSLRLKEAAQALPEDSPLRRVLEETAALAYVESFKFKRGDYL